MRLCGAAVLALVCLLSAVKAPCHAEGLPDGFVYLRNIDDTIVEDMRYATRKNFVGRPLEGYQAPRCVLVEEAARALASLQAELARSHLALVVLDCYRPEGAVADMVDHVTGNFRRDRNYHPNLRADQLLSGGYVARRSGHSAGGTVDLTLAYTASGKPAYLDMGTEFDFFDPKSHSRSHAVSGAAMRNRAYLISVMDKAGFSNYPKEWWHFRFRNEPFRGAVFDFPITRRP